MDQALNKVMSLWQDLYGDESMPDPRPLLAAIKSSADESLFSAALAQYRGDKNALKLVLAVGNLCSDVGQLRCLSKLADELAPNRAGTDPLTGLLDHGGSWEAFRREWERANRHGKALTLIVIDLAGFKQVNDTIGHINGDRLLARIAELLKTHARASDIVGRIGGDEFMIILTETPDEAAGHELMRRVRIHLGPLKRDGIVPATFDLDYGVASYEPDGPVVMFQKAEAGLYEGRGKSLESNDPLKLPRLHVLVIEDEFALADLAKAVLKTRGYSVDLAHTLAQAKESLQDRAPDLVLLDLRLPDGSGWDLLQSGVLDGVPVIVTTGYRSEGELARAVQLGVFDYLLKPYEPDQLQQAVERVLLLSGEVE